MTDFTGGVSGIYAVTTAATFSDLWIFGATPAIFSIPEVLDQFVDVVNLDPRAREGDVIRSIVAYDVGGGAPLSRVFSLNYHQDSGKDALKVGLLQIIGSKLLVSMGNLFSQPHLRSNAQKANTILTEVVKDLTNLSSGTPPSFEQGRSVILNAGRRLYEYWEVTADKAGYSNTLRLWNDAMLNSYYAASTNWMFVTPASVAYTFKCLHGITSKELPPFVFVPAIRADYCADMYGAKYCPDMYVDEVNSPDMVLETVVNVPASYTGSSMLWVNLGRFLHDVVLGDSAGVVMRESPARKGYCWQISYPEGAE
jgi:hypothetical protein